MFANFKFPTAFTILFALIAVVAMMTHIIPAGSYEMVFSEALDADVPVVGTYALTESNPQGWWDVLKAPALGIAGSIDVVFFILVIGGFLGLVAKTGAIDIAVAKLMNKLTGREELMIPILMAVFAAMGTIYGAAEETLGFYALLVPVMMAARFDPVVAAATVLLGAGIGTLGSTINPFATVIASDAAGISIADGMNLRFGILGLGWLICVAYVMHYAKKVRLDPTKSIVWDKHEENVKHFLGDRVVGETLTGAHKLILAVFTAAFGIMIYGVSVLGWWMEELAALFLAGSIIVGLIARMAEEELVDNFVNGARDLLGVALIIGIARGIVVVMDSGQITHTILASAEGLFSGLGPVEFINAIFGIEIALSFLVPSSSGLAVLTMPIMAPLADFAGVAREAVVTAYQSASGLVNLITPTSGVVMGGLAIARVPYARWVKWVAPLMLVLAVMIIALLSYSVI